jgi:glucan phosphorylase
MREGVIAYFSTEIALGSHIPTCSGGLGVLAGDTLRVAADLGVPMVGVTLLARQGHFAGDPPRWAEVMRLTIAVNASFFNAHRML